MSSRPSPAFARARRRATERLARVTRIASLGGVALALAPGGAAQAPAAPAPADGVLNADHLRRAPGLDGPVRLLEKGSMMASVPTFGPRTMLPFNTGTPGRPVQADLDGDGDLDLFLGAYSGGSGVRFQFYENTSGPGDPPTYAAGQDNPFNLGQFAAQAPNGSTIPDLADMDGDGDLDMVVSAGYYYAPATYYYVQNFGTPTAPQFFGGFALGSSYTPYPSLGDLDGDGDNDLLLGTGYPNNDFVYRENTTTAGGGLSFGAPVSDPFGLVSIGYSVTPELADFDADGDLDLLASSNGSDTYYYPNTGTAAAPAFGPAVANPAGLGGGGPAKQYSAGDYDGDGDLDLAVVRFGQSFVFLQPQAPAPPVTPAQFAAPVVNPYGLGFVGGTGLSRPAAVDIDGDGDLDLFASGNGTAIRYHQNTAGPDATPAFLASVPNPFGLSSVGGYASLSFEDLDGDGDLDLMAGDYGGDFQYMENTGTPTAPAFAAIQDNPFGLARITNNVSPTLADLDGDGDIDVLAGWDDLNLRYYENTAGPDATPAFAAPVVNPFGLTASTSGTFNSTFPTPTFGDLDGDGDLDVLVGERSGSVRYFENTAGPAAPPAFAAVQTNPFGFTRLFAQVAFSTPDLVDLDGDGDLDLITGESGGSILFYENTADPVSNAVTGTVAGTAGWRMLAAPVAGATLETLLDFTHTQGYAGSDAPAAQPTVFFYDESVGGSENNGYVQPTTRNDVVAPGSGVWAYLFADDDVSQPGTQGGFPKTLSVTGAQESVAFGWGADGAGTLDYTDTGSGTDDGWNLLGNPFASWMDWDAVELTDVDAPVYVYDDAAASYKTHVSGVAGSLPGGIVGPFQGFWVRASAPTAGLHARPAVTNGGPLYKSGEAPTVVGLRLKPADGSALPAQIDAQAFLALGVAGSADGPDRLDAWALGSPAAQHVALAVGDGLAIDARPDITAETTVELSLNAVGADGSTPLVLDWPGLDLPDGWTARLLDRETGTSTTLADGGSYAFDLAAAAARDAQTLPTLRPSAPDGLTTGRFALVVTPANIVHTDDAPTAASLSQTMPNPARGTARLTLSLPTAERVRAAVYDALGREVAVLADGEMSGVAELRLDTSRLAAGVYVVRVEGDSFAETRRLTVIR